MLAALDLINLLLRLLQMCRVLRAVTVARFVERWSRGIFLWVAVAIRG